MIRLNHGVCATRNQAFPSSSDVLRQWVELDQLLLLGENDGKGE